MHFSILYTNVHIDIVFLVISFRYFVKMLTPSPLLSKCNFQLCFHFKLWRLQRIKKEKGCLETIMLVDTDWQVWYLQRSREFG